MEEKWEDIPGFEGYQVSTMCAVRSFRRRGVVDRSRPARNLVPNGGAVTLQLGGKPVRRSVIKLRDLAFPELMPVVGAEPSDEVDQAVAQVLADIE